MKPKARFVSFDKMKYSIPFVKRNNDGIVIENRDIRFTPGSKRLGKLVPAYYETENQDEIDYMKEYPAYGVTFREVTEKEPTKAKAKAKLEVVFPEDEPGFDEEEVEENEEELGPSVIDDVTTPQKANIRLRQLDPKLKTSDVKTMEDILKHAERLNVEFPNLKE